MNEQGAVKPTAVAFPLAESISFCPVVKKKTASSRGRVTKKRTETTTETLCKEKGSSSRLALHEGVVKEDDICNGDRLVVNQYTGSDTFFFFSRLQTPFSLFVVS